MKLARGSSQAIGVHNQLLTPPHEWWVGEGLSWAVTKRIYRLSLCTWFFLPLRGVDNNGCPCCFRQQGFQPGWSLTATVNWRPRKRRVSIGFSPLHTMWEREISICLVLDKDSLRMKRGETFMGHQNWQRLAQGARHTKSEKRRHLE